MTENKKMLYFAEFYSGIINNSLINGTLRHGNKKNNKTATLSIHIYNIKTSCQAGHI